MDAVQSSRRQSIALPPISPLNNESSMNGQQRHSLGGATHGSSTTSLSSPNRANNESSATVSGSNDGSAQSNTMSMSAISAQTIAAGSVLASLSGTLSPSDHRRTVEDKLETHRQPKQSLPSIHEALRNDVSRSYAEPMRSSHSTSFPSPLSDSQRRQNNPERHPSYQQSNDLAAKHPAPSPHLITSGQNFAPSSLPPPPPPPFTRPNADTTSRPLSPSLQSGKLPALHTLSTNASPVSAVPPPPIPPPPPPSYGYSRRPQPPFEGSNHTPSVNGPPGLSQSSPQTPRHRPYPPPPQFGHTTPTSPSSTAPLTFPSYPGPPVPPQYFPSAAHAHPGLGHTYWRNEQAGVSEAQESKRSGGMSEATYGESVKRHLDLFDLEASLNEIAEGSGRMLDFTKLYGRLAHQSPRNELMPTTMPTLAEIDDLISREGKMHESLIRIREMILAQQTVLAEQAYEPGVKGSAGLAVEEDAKPYAANVNGSDSKRRKGRAAPPGRCHSCSRAETPEWRRGPDGARTLCNACGLHYAKLTRKMGQNSDAANGASSLRPKPAGRASSPAR